MLTSVGSVDQSIRCNSTHSCINVQLVLPHARTIKTGMKIVIETYVLRHGSSYNISSVLKSVMARTERGGLGDGREGVFESIEKITTAPTPRDSGNWLLKTLVVLANIRDLSPAVFMG